MFGGCTVALGAMTLVNVIAVTAQNLSFRANNFYRSKSIQIQPINSSSFIISAAKINSHLKAIATISIYNIGSITRNSLQKSQTLAQRKELINAAIAQR
ncbi:hypothetical protein H9Q73_010728 [Fusarium xylarioides]|nr:hypothetical protein H9Q73_010728 [Fusarium xylarioides]